MTKDEAYAQLREYPDDESSYDAGDWSSVWGAAEEENPPETQNVKLGDPYYYGEGGEIRPAFTSWEDYAGPVVPYEPETPEASSAGFSTTRPLNTPYESGSSWDWASGYRSAGISAGSKRVSGITSASAQKPYATVSMQQRQLPRGTQWPTFQGPTYNEREIRQRAAKLMAPGLTQLTMKTQQALSRYYENPNVRRMVLRDTLAGYGLGISGIRAKAEQVATQQYMADYSRQYNEAMNAYNLAMQKASYSALTVTTQKQFATQQGYDEWMKKYEEVA